MAVFTREQIKNFPSSERARVRVQGNNTYVAEYEHAWNPELKRPETKIRLLGKVADDGTYYPMDEYRRKFMRDGTPRAIPADAVPVTRRPGRKARPRKPPVDLEQVRNYPHGEDNVYPQRTGGILYVVRREFYFDETGRKRERRTYLGRIDNMEYHTLAEWRAMKTVSGSGKKD